MNMKWTSFIMPVVLGTALFFSLPHMAVTGEAAALTATLLAACAWLVGRAGNATVNFFTSTGNTCAGIVPTILVIFGGGFFAPYIVIQMLASQLPGAASLSDWAGVLASIVCFGGFFLRKIVGAVVDRALAR